MSNYLKVSQMPDYSGDIKTNEMIFLVSRKDPTNAIQWTSRKISYKQLVNLLRTSSGDSYGFKAQLATLNKINQEYIAHDEIFGDNPTSPELISPKVLPSFVSDISVFNTFNEFPENPDKASETIFIDKSTNRSYRYEANEYWRVGDYTQWSIFLKYEEGSSALISAEKGSNTLSLDISSKLNKELSSNFVLTSNFNEICSFLSTQIDKKLDLDLSNSFALSNHTHERFNELSNYEAVSSFVYSETKRLQDEINNIELSGDSLPRTFLSSEEFDSTTNIGILSVDVPVKCIRTTENPISFANGFQSDKSNSLNGVYTWELFLKYLGTDQILSLNFNNSALQYVGNEELNESNTLSIDIGSKRDKTIVLAVRNIPTDWSGIDSPWQVNFEYAF